MKSPVRSVRFGLRTAGVACSVGLLVVFAVQTAGAKTDTRTAPLAAHKCLVMTGSGDPAFVKNFNPFTAVGLPSGAFVRGAFYEPLIITTPAGGGHRYPWLARNWKWSNGNKTLTLSLARGVKWSDGKPLTSADVVYTLTAGKQDKVLDQIGLYRPGTNLVSVRAKGRYGVVINLKTPDSQFIAANLNVVFVLPKHIWSKVANPSTYTNSRPVGSGPFTQITRFTSQSYVFGKNPRYWKKGAPKIPCIEYVQASSNDAALLLIQSGQVDWTHNFVPNVESAYERRDPAHYHAFYATTAYPIGLMLDTTQVPVQPEGPAEGDQPGNRSKDGLEARRVRLRTARRRSRAERSLPTVGHRPRGEGRAKTMADLQPGRREEAADGQRLHVQGQPAIRPEGQPRRDQSARDLWLVGLGRVAADHHGKPARNRDRLPHGARAGLELLVPERVEHEGTHAPLAGRLDGLAVRLLLLDDAQQRLHRRPAQDGTTTGNWIHYRNGGATALLNKWKVTLNRTAQRKIATQLQKLWLDELPMVPLFIGPRWSTYSTKYFHCFTSPKNFYGDPIFTTFPDNVLSFTRICPGGKAGP